MESLESEKTFLTSLSEKAQDKILQKYRIIEPFLKKEKKLTQISKEQGISLKTAKNWVLKYRKHGLIGLSRSKRKDKGNMRICSEELQNIIEGIYLRDSHLSKASIHRKIKEFTHSKVKMSQLQNNLQHYNKYASWASFFSS